MSEEKWVVEVLMTGGKTYLFKFDTKEAALLTQRKIVYYNSGWTEIGDTYLRCKDAIMVDVRAIKK